MKKTLLWASRAAFVFLLIPATPALSMPFEEFDTLPLSLTFNLGSLSGGETISVSGPITIKVTFDDVLEGSANDDSGNGLDEVNTELIAMDLTGTSSLGDVFVFLNAALPSTGVMEEVGNITPGVLDLPPFTPAGAADSFFNVFFDIDIGGFLLLQNTSPVAIGGRITHKPPLGNELGTLITTDPVELVDPNGEPTGFFLQRATAIAEPGSLAILGLGFLGLGVMRRRVSAGARTGQGSAGRGGASRST